jgi:RND family efflux transporter MFP subunit
MSKVMMDLKIIITILVILSITGIGCYGYFFKDKKLSYDFVVAEIGDIFQEVSATGAVDPSKKINLQFKAIGKIKNILVEEGDNVEAGQILVELEKDDLYIKRQQAEAVLDLAQAKLEQILAGESQEQIEVYKTAVKNVEETAKDVEISLENAEQNLADVRAIAEMNLDQSLEDAINVLDDSYLKVYNCFNVIDLMQRTYFTSNDQESIIVKENKLTAEEIVSCVKEYVDLNKNNTRSEENVNIAFNEIENYFNNVNSSLNIIRNIMGQSNYKHTVSSTDKTSIDTQRTNINIGLTNIINSRQSVSLINLTNQTNINTAKTSVDTAVANLNTAKGNLETAKNKLSLAEAGPRQTDIALYEAQISEAQANLSLTQEQINDATLKSPINGAIINVSGEIGEMVKANISIITIISKNAFQIEADISEANIGKVELGHPVKITLDAFSEQEFLGKIIQIEPAETVIQGVVYYKIIIAFDKIKENVKPGMTANIIITTDFRKNVLTIPQRAVSQKQGKEIVKIPSDGLFSEKEIKTGLKGSNGAVEVLSGLSQGDKVITFIKKQ